MDRFIELESELKIFLHSIEDRLKSSLPYATAGKIYITPLKQIEKRKREIRDIENDIDEAYAIVKLKKHIINKDWTITRSSIFSSKKR